MAFEQEDFPYVPLKHDRRVTVIDPVNVVTNGTYEYRVRKQRWEKFSFEISPQTMTNAQKEAVRVFLSERGAGLNSFWYTDPELSTWTDVPLLRWYNDYFKVMMPFGATAGDRHPIFNVDLTGITGKKDNGDPVTIASTSTVDGFPVIVVSGYPTGNITISGTVKFNVRLDSSFSDTLYALDCNNNAIGHQVDAIRLMEVHGE